MNDRMDACKKVVEDACKLTGACWAAWLTINNGHWELGPRYGIKKAGQSALIKLLVTPKFATMLAGAMSIGHTRWMKTDVKSLNCQRIYIFPNPGRRHVLMTGISVLDKQTERIFRIAAFVPPQTAMDEMSIPFEEPQQPIWHVRAEQEASYNPQLILDNILEFLTSQVECDAAYLAIRSGETFHIQSTWYCQPTAQNLGLSIREVPLIQTITDTRQGTIFTDQNGEWETTLPQVTEQPAKEWMGIPIVIGQRVIGLIAFVMVMPSHFNQEALQQATLQVMRLAYNIENAVIFSEATRYLQQLALLNELGMTASLSIDINEVSRRVMQRLRRAFDIDWAAVFLFSTEENILREYGGEGRAETPLTLPLDRSLVGHTITTGLPQRVNDLRSEARFTPLRPELRSEMAAPLKFRGKVIGAIDLVSKEPNAFLIQDEQLLILIAGHLAGLFENLRLNEELRAYIRQLEESQRALIQAEKMAIAGRLTASIAHEINNPLQAVDNCLHLAGRKELSPEERENYLGLAQEELDRLTQTVQRMLDFYRPSAVDRQPTDINALLNKVLLLMAKQFHDRSVRVHTSYAANLPEIFLVGDQIQQVFLNLALNAVEAMPDGGDLFIETRQDKDQIEILFQDTGLGVPVSKRRMIFEPFVSTKQGGTGLGLAISYGIITAHAGSLELLEQNGEGACFRISFKVGKIE
jgi:signal transduction histidine kinase